MDPELHAKLDEAAKRAESRNDKAELIICANVLFNAGMGVFPFGIDMWLFVGANVAAIIALGYLYGFTKNREQRRALIKQIFSAAGYYLRRKLPGNKVIFRGPTRRGPL